MTPSKTPPTPSIPCSSAPTLGKCPHGKPLSWISAEDSASWGGSPATAWLGWAKTLALHNKARLQAMGLLLTLAWVWGCLVTLYWQFHDRTGLWHP